MIEPKRHTPLLYGSLQNLFFPPEPGEYSYFARAAEKPYASGDMIVQAAWAADAAMLCYARYGSRRMSEDEFRANLTRGGLIRCTAIGNWSAHGTQGYFAEGAGFAMLAFRGTEVDDPADATTDLDVMLVHEAKYDGALVPAHPEEGFLEHWLGTPCLVHRGFQ